MSHQDAISLTRTLLRFDTINPPGRDGVSDVFFGGPNMQWLYVTDGDKIYRRSMKHRGATTWAPVKPPQPRL